MTAEVDLLLICYEEHESNECYDSKMFPEGSSNLPHLFLRLTYHLEKQS